MITLFFLFVSVILSYHDYRVSGDKYNVFFNSLEFDSMFVVAVFADAIGAIITFIILAGSGVINI